MNRHFNRDEREFPKIAKRCYALLDHAELVLDKDSVVLHFDLIDADWLDRKLSSLVQGRAADGKFLSLAHSWYRKKLAARENPFSDAPLYRLRLAQSESGLRGKSLGLAVTEMHGKWMEFHCMQAQFPGGMPGQIYPGLFSAAVPVFVAGKLVTVHKHKRLTAMHDLSFFATISDNEVSHELSKSQSAALAVYDVGQGNCNALLAPESNKPTLYYDLGAGVYGNHHTTPPLLRFCFSQKPTILLSHWDADHWAGAYATEVDGKFPALRQNWIVPRQEISSLHLVFAFDIWTSGNGDNLSVFAPAKGNVISSINASGHCINLWRGNGSGTNESGLVIEVRNPARGGDLSWLLTGDCDYYYFPKAKKKQSHLAIVAPHHGANLLKTSPVPLKPVAGYARLIYSMGANNQHSGVSHPTHQGVNSHEKAGWQHGKAYLAQPGHDPFAGKSIRATNTHISGAQRGGVIVGWVGAPAIPANTCNTTCTITPTAN